MVELATVPDRIVTSTAPTSSVSRGDIIGNTNLMAKAMSDTADATLAIGRAAGQIGDDVMDVATTLAKKQAADDLQQQKVVRNDDGSVSVQNPASAPLLFGRAGEAYQAAVQAGTIAQHGNVISSEMNELHQQYPTDPAAFNKAADAWKVRYLQDHGGGLIGQAIAQQTDQVQTQHSMSITNSAGKIDLNNQDSALTANQTSARDDVMAMLRGGANIDDKAVQSRIAQYDATTEARANNPLFGYSQEQAKLDRETFHGEAAASRMLYHVDQIYKDQGPNGGKTAALKSAEDILTNPNYKLSDAQREQYYHRAVGEIRANEAIRKQDIGEARAAFSELTLASAAGARIESDQVEQVAGAFRAAGDPGSAARVYSSFIRKPLNDDFGKQPLAMQTQQLTALQGANAAAAAQKFFIGKGYTPEQSAGIVGNLVHESGVNPFASGDGGTSGGLAQFHNERLTALRDYAKSVGKPATDFNTQLEFIDKELRGGKSGFFTSNLAAADAALKLTPEEKGLYQRHLTNLTGPGGVDNPDGSRSTLFQTTVEHDGKFYTIPTVFDGKILWNPNAPDKAAAAIEKVKEIGWDKFPSYKSEDEAEARYQQMHAFMEKDTAAYKQPGSEAATYQKLQGAKTPEQAAAAFIDYERPQGWTPENPGAGLGYQSRQNLARSVFNGRPGDMSMGPAGSAWLAANRARDVDDAATAQWKTVMSDYTKEGTRPALSTVNDIVTAARTTRNADLLDTIAHDAERMDLSGEFARGSLPQQHATLTSMSAAGESGQLSPGMAATQKDLQRRSDAITSGLKENPIATTVTNFPDKIKPPAPLDFSSDQNLAAGLKSRGQVAQFAAQNWQTPPVAALDASEVQQVQAMLLNPDPAVKGRIFNGLSTLPEDVRNATLAKIGANRPDLMVSVAAGSMMKAAPDIGSSIIRGQAAIAVDKGYLPEKGGEAAAFDQKFNEHIPASTFSLAARTDASGPYAVAQGLVKARYADLSAQSADTTGKLNTDRLSQAVADVTGGILDHNGGKLIAPVRGMPQSIFDRTMYGVTDNDLQGVSTLNGEPVTANYLRNSATLESVGDGRYYVKLGRDPMKPVYAYSGANTESPQKFMLDLRNRPLGVVPPAMAMVQP